MFDIRIKKKDLIGALIQVFLIIFGSVLFAIGMSGSEFIQSDTSAQLISNHYTNSDIDRLTLSYTEFDEEGNCLSPSLFQSRYSGDYSGNYYLPYYLLDDDICRFTLNVNGFDYTGFAGSDLGYYSNHERTMKFERANINLYKIPNKSEEMNPYECDGTIYIPDFLADQIINASNGSLKTYDDLVPTLSEYTSDERKTFLDKYSVKATYGNTTRVLKISNIFHVEGFNEKYMSGEYKYSDTELRLYFRYFLGNYVIVSDSQIAAALDSSVFSSVSPKKYSVYEELDKLANEAKQYDVKVTCYDLNENQCVMNEEITALCSASIFTDYSLGAGSILLIVFGWIVVVGSFVTLFIVKKKRQDLVGRTGLVYSFGLLIFLLFIQFILFKSFGYNNAFYLTTMSMTLNIPIVLSILALIVIWFIWRKKDYAILA